MRITRKNILKIIFNTRCDKYKFVAISFEFINAPVTFLIIINNIFKSYLDRFVIMYLDDILIFSDTLLYNRSSKYAKPLQSDSL